VGILEYLLGPKNYDPDDARPARSQTGVGPDVDEGRNKSETEKDLRRVQSTHDPASDSFKGKRDAMTLPTARERVPDKPP
jgi:hypothetical protein